LMKQETKLDLVTLILSNISSRSNYLVEKTNSKLL